MPAISLTDLQQQIAARERELQALRQELESRQSHLTELTNRKEQLQSQLRQVEEEIAALAAAAATPNEPPTKTAPSPLPASGAEGQPPLDELIVTLLREAREPMTARQLNDEAQRRGYRSSSRDPLKAMGNRLQELKSKGVIQRASSQYGFILPSSTNGAKKQKSQTSQPAPTSTPKTPSKPAKSESAAKKSSGEGSSSSGAAQTARIGSPGEQPSLREVLTTVLKSSRKPLSASELAARILASGYQTNSKKFVKVVRTQLRKMTDVEHMPDKSYRLKKKT